MLTFPAPDFDEHCEKRDKAKAAQLALQKVSLKEHADWIVIIAFYQALHWVDAYLISVGHQQPTGHEKRKNPVRSNPSLRPIYRHFEYMHTASEPKILADIATENGWALPPEKQCFPRIESSALYSPSFSYPRSPAPTSPPNPNSPKKT